MDFHERGGGYLFWDLFYFYALHFFFSPHPFLVWCRRGQAGLARWIWPPLHSAIYSFSVEVRVKGAILSLFFPQRGALLFSAYSSYGELSYCRRTASTAKLPILYPSIPSPPPIPLHPKNSIHLNQPPSNLPFPYLHLSSPSSLLASHAPFSSSLPLPPPPLPQHSSYVMRFPTHANRDATNGGSD